MMKIAVGICCVCLLGFAYRSGDRATDRIGQRGEGFYLFLYFLSGGTGIVMLYWLLGFFGNLG